jgi:hypothetical protein
MVVGSLDDRKLKLKHFFGSIVPISPIFKEYLELPILDSW